VADDTKFSELMTETVGGRERSTQTDSLIEQISTVGGVGFESGSYVEPVQRGKRGNKGNKTAKGTGLATGGAQRDRHACFGTKCEQKGTNLVSIPHDGGTHFVPMCYDCKETAIKNAKKRGLPVPTSTNMTSQIADIFDVQDESSVEFNKEERIPRSLKPGDRSVRTAPRSDRVEKTQSRFKSSSGTGKPGVSIVNAVVEAMDPERVAATMPVMAHRIKSIPGEEKVTTEQLNASPRHPLSASESPAYVNRALFEAKGRRGELDVGLVK
jgi:hypothetical protein